MRVQLGLARRLGARLHLGERVNSWAASANGVTVDTDAGTYGADQLVLCAGPWIGTLLSERRTFAVYRQLLFWFAIRERYEELRRDAGVRVGVRPRASGLQALRRDLRVPGDRRARRRRQAGDRTLRAHDGARWSPASGDASGDRARCTSGSSGPGCRGSVRRPVRTVSCLYTCTRHSTFVIDRHPEHDAVVIVSACSGHGFKHSPAIGEAVAQLVVGGRARDRSQPVHPRRARRLTQLRLAARADQRLASSARCARASSCSNSGDSN